MRILFVAVFQSNHCDRHINVVSRGGHDVHLAVIDPSSHACLELHDGITIHRREQTGAVEQLAAPDESIAEDIPVTEDEMLAMADLAMPSHGAAGAARWLAALIEELQPDAVHSFSLHQATFLTAAAKPLCRSEFPKWMASNWGCDIHFFGRQRRYRRALASVLPQVDGYFAECGRDVRLARELGLSAPVLAIEPIGGGFDIEWFRNLRTAGASGNRRWFMLKGYIGTLGRVHVALEGIRRLGKQLRKYPLAIYGGFGLTVADVHSVRTLGIDLTLLPYMSYADLMRWHGKARCSIALSDSDGICTSAIEAMLMGSLPLQSDSSCLAEWTDPDATLLVACDDADAVEAALYRALDDGFVNRCVDRNDRALEERFSPAAVDAKIVAMYERLAS